MNLPPAPLSRKLRVSTVLFSSLIFRGMDEEFLFICPAKIDWIHNNDKGVDVETAFCIKNPDPVHLCKRCFSPQQRFPTSGPTHKPLIPFLSTSFSPPSWFLPSSSCSGNPRQMSYYPAIEAGSLLHQFCSLIGSQDINVHHVWKLNFHGVLLLLTFLFWVVLPKIFCISCQFCS